MTIQVTDNQDFKVLHFNVHKIDAVNAENIKQTIDTVLESTNNIIISFENVQYIDSTGIGSLLYTYRKVNEKKGLLKMCNLNAVVFSILAISKLETVFSISKSYSEAEDDLIYQLKSSKL